MAHRYSPLFLCVLERLLLVFLLYFLNAINPTRCEVPAVIVFGDSSVDAGNNNVISTLLKSNFQPYGRDFDGGRPTGRFSNGKIPPDYISQAFGLKPNVPAYLDPNYGIADFVTGVCFASDFLVELSRSFITELYKMGARKISLTGVPPMGCLPLERATNFMDHHACVREYNDVALEFNGKLDAMVGQLNKELEGLKVVFTRDVYGLVLDMITKPSSYGFEVAGMSCCATGTFEMGYLCNRHSITCEDANKYVFWDAFHPSERTNQIVSSHLIPILKSEFK
ncbi:unnamed protein product [Linum tenue]|uniref:Uncharacterized protein n=1 Tax=Linum tenue TaxID=586396 RepID=A0AAV0R0J0_9ROSI|nr:unnamed protein product [Linum tenue]